MDILPATPADLDHWTAMREALWPDEDGLRGGAEAMLANPDMLALIVHADGKPVAFAEAALRRDYVNGCDTSPVAFLEGIYVEPEHRRSGVAQALANAAAEWGRAKGCTEFASDILADNHESHVFHTAIGFEETERVIYFRRVL
ncbi:GNAT family N-acetyltransferase [Sphingomonas sp. AOB5]|uniref:aminoglycoside 6'-N-acetyltransferase n=1 Tax=Sphingomonas sp. AOB5 TaxID=3034017 RepID=UPI0023F9D524|nr:aminoglycoside 6'-N-acetyltransferase [Sphingomonas sp. AOB5]MDF7773976.1 GNAT family N-acetyltransferase [Sphingomonas sp. AOB5]